MDEITWKISDPYVFQSLQTVVGKPIVVQTVRGSVRGSLKKVVPDHIVVESAGNSFYIRTDQIIWVVPNPKLMPE
ncbi:YuzF family protein [Metabacillus fastidiosus]|uniref:YuzF family protein n=1 Tax=Metabacillus fastidiosus TaxID=1458 RepID=UPI002DBF830C|nr:YuzF family protein [Metabacillus fastidiosus]MEC2075020.1 YuzF family protein [Metabacillus fastidiosus]MED4533364.1 YuzF family protein [Metabacillus fastidiosus]